MKLFHYEVVPSIIVLVNFFFLFQNFFGIVGTIGIDLLHLFSNLAIASVKILPNPSHCKKKYSISVSIHKNLKRMTYNPYDALHPSILNDPSHS